jgi:hypothetical protein
LFPNLHPKLKLVVYFYYLQIDSLFYYKLLE